MTIWVRIPKGFHVSTASLLCLSVLFTSFSQSASMPTACPPAENITIIVPEDTQNHGNPKLLCTPSKWTNVATFFLAKLLAHAATVKSLPGEPALSALLSLVFALVFPTSGISRGLSAIHQRAVLVPTPLKTAARARTLCMVVRTSKWRPQIGDIVKTLGYMVSQKHKTAVMYKPGFEFVTSKEMRVIDGDKGNWV